MTAGPETDVQHPLEEEVEELLAVIIATMTVSRVENPAIMPEIVASHHMDEDAVGLICADDIKHRLTVRNAHITRRVHLLRIVTRNDQQVHKSRLLLNTTRETRSGGTCTPPYTNWNKRTKYGCFI